MGPTGDITLLREDPMPFGRWAESTRDGSTPEEDRIRVWVDRGYQGTGRDLPGATLMIPHKRALVDFGDQITKIYQGPHGTPEENRSRHLSFEGLGLERTFASSYTQIRQ